MNFPWHPNCGRQLQRGAGAETVLIIGFVYFMLIPPFFDNILMYWHNILTFNILEQESKVNKIFEACVDKEHLSKENIMDDCKEVLDTLERKGLIICRRSNV